MLPRRATERCEMDFLRLVLRVNNSNEIRQAGVFCVWMSTAESLGSGPGSRIQALFPDQHQIIFELSVNRNPPPATAPINLPDPIPQRAFVVTSEAGFRVGSAVRV